MSKFLSSAFSALAPYTPGEQPQNRKYIKLNTNESPFPPAPGVIKAINSDKVSELNLYSDPQASTLISAIAENFGVRENMVAVGNGSDELLAFSFMAFCEKGVAYADITYGFYEVYAELFGLDSKVIPLSDNFEVVPEDYFNLGRTVFIANPNAPTGLTLPISKIEEILINNRENLVVIDEAYVDFGGESAIKLVDKYDNLLVIGTFSKSRNLAGARIGYAVSNPSVIEDLGKMKFSFNPYNLNRLSIIAGTESMKDRAYFEKCTELIKQARAFAIKELSDLGFDILDSKANFIFARSNKISGNDYYLKLKDHGILVRWFNRDRIRNFVRITIGTEEQMQALIDATREILS
ncbi:MAG: histidinol-phosphate transaminase [Ruminococcaceae bacterium]|nr:histidinol-phosphate transaminase [Oscillospiraceae bacterium]